jgi:hypothetical protein
MTFVRWFGLEDICRCGSFISSLPSLPLESELRDFGSTGDGAVMNNARELIGV